MYISIPTWDKYLYVCIFVTFAGMFIRSSRGATVFVSPGDTIMCSGFASTPLSVALPVIAGFCSADARCSELYGQNLGPNITLFDHLFQITNEIPFPVLLESPLFLTLCNRTVEQINEQLWPKELKGGMLDSSIVCGLSERPLFDASTGETYCVSFPGREMRDPHSVDGVVLTLMILLVVAVVLNVGMSVWDSSLRWMQMRNRLASTRGKR